MGVKMNPDVAKLCLFSVGGDLALRKYALEGGASNAALGLTGYAMALNSLVEMYRGGMALGVANNVWNATTGLVEMLLSVYLGENLAHEDWIGGVLIISGLLFVRV